MNTYYQNQHNSSSARKPSATINQITFKNGHSISLTNNQIVVFVGPNNVGKSVVLKEVYDALKADHSSTRLIVSKVTNRIFGIHQDLENYLANKYKKSVQTPGFYVLPTGEHINHLQIMSHWNPNQSLNMLAAIFSKLLTTEDRLQISKTVDNINIINESPKHPIHYLQLNEQLETQFSSYFKQAFGLDLILNRGAGRMLPFHVGTAPALHPGEHKYSVSYLSRLVQLPTLDQQGDGMRSFVGVLLSVFVSDESMVFIDEPEAFLHPPQAYILGQMLSEKIDSNKQLFISTHSEDLLKGLIDRYSDRIKIIRIQRQGNNNTFHELDSHNIKQLWKDPLLKYSNILSGLFHSKVVLCESDGDCRFFGAITDVLTDEPGTVKPDILFVHCGGKHRMPVVVNALKRLDVKLLVVSDIDLLNSDSPLKEIFEGLGGSWPMIASEWLALKKAVESKRPELETSDVLTLMEKALADVNRNDRVFPKDKAEEIKKILSKVSPWAEVKKAGKSFIPPGDATIKFADIVSVCKQVGLYILEVGELEGFDKTIGGHGPKWVNHVLEKDLKSDPELDTARRFVQQLIDR